MASRLYQKYGPTVFGQVPVLEDVNDVWYHAGKLPNGQLKLLDQPFARQRRGVISWSPSNANSAAYLPILFESSWAPLDLLDPLKAETYAKLRGKLYYGSAALGVTLGSWKQSREMIVSRYRQMSLQADSFERYARRVISSHRYRKGKTRYATTQVHLDKLGSQYLEMVFGWQPLLSDIYAAARTVIDDQPAAQRLTARSRAYHSTKQTRTVWVAKVDTQITGVIRYTRGVTVEIDNPNKWLRERAGLNNPAAVAWDLVPWSWVVNLFSNVGGIVNSITDFAGLEFPSNSGTYHFDLRAHSQISSTNSGVSMSGTSALYWNHKRTTLGDGVTRPPLVLRVPDVNWGLAAIAASVFAQKFRALNTLILK